jgi:predicted Zn-dependent protease
MEKLGIINNKTVLMALNNKHVVQSHSMPATTVKFDNKDSYVRNKETLTPDNYINATEAIQMLSSNNTQVCQEEYEKYCTLYEKNGVTVYFPPQGALDKEKSDWINSMKQLEREGKSKEIANIKWLMISEKRNEQGMSVDAFAQNTEQLKFSSADGACIEFLLKILAKQEDTLKKGNFGSNLKQEVLDDVIKNTKKSINVLKTIIEYFK